MNVLQYNTKCTIYTSGTRLHRLRSNVKMYLCTYISQVYIHNRCAIFTKFSFNVSTHLYISVCLHVYHIYTCKYLYMYIAVYFIYVSLACIGDGHGTSGKGTRASPMIAFRMLLLTAYRQRERKKKKKSTIFLR